MLVGDIRELLQALPDVFLLLLFITDLLWGINVQEVMLFWVAADRAFYTGEGSSLGLEPAEVTQGLFLMSASFGYAFVGVIDVITFWINHHLDEKMMKNLVLLLMID